MHVGKTRTLSEVYKQRTDAHVALKVEQKLQEGTALLFSVLFFFVNKNIYFEIFLRRKTWVNFPICDPDTSFKSENMARIFVMRRKTKRMFKFTLLLASSYLVFVWLFSNNSQETAEEAAPPVVGWEPVVVDDLELSHRLQRREIADHVPSSPILDALFADIPDSNNIDDESIGNIAKDELVIMNEYDLAILEDLRRQEPELGAGGNAVQLVGQELKEADEIVKKESFNTLISDRMPYNRSLRDMRDEACKAITYDEDLPMASVIIIFTNEVFSALMRTVWSVINRSPKKYLKEILLVDDFSDRADLHGKLDRCVFYVCAAKKDSMFLFNAFLGTSKLSFRLSSV